MCNGHKEPDREQYQRGRHEYRDHYEARQQGATNRLKGRDLLATLGDLIALCDRRVRQDGVELKDPMLVLLHH